MITLDNLSCTYTRKHPVLDKIDLKISCGYIHGLLGKNGEGKSTLLKIISGLLFPNSGTCTVFDETPSKRHVSFLTKVFILPEDLVLPNMTVKNYFSMYTPFYPTFSNEILHKCISHFEINVTDPIGKMSLGQKKKVALTLALAANTPILLLDEPTNGLDIPSKSIFRKLLASQMTDDKTIILSTHQVRDLDSLIDSVIILNNHQIILHKDLTEIGDKLFFGRKAGNATPLYSESTMLGNVCVVENTNKESSLVNVELLFNAAITNPSKIKEIFA